MLRILHYIPSLEPAQGGVGAYMALLQRSLGEMCDLHVATHKTAEQHTLDHCTVHYLPLVRTPWPNARKAFLALLDKVRPDVVHTNGCWNPPMVGQVALWAKQAGYKVVYTPHGMLEPWIMSRGMLKKWVATQVYQRQAVRCADVVHATAESERQHLIEQGWNKQVVVVPNCVQVDQITMRTSWEKRRNLLFLSRIHPKKGIHILLDALVEVGFPMRHYRLTVAGPAEPAYLAQLKAQVERLGLTHRVDFVGPVYGEEKWRLLREADAFVLPTYSENFGIVVAEALACGTPVITTTGTPWQELNTHHCGWWIDLDHSQLAEALRRLMETPADMLEAMGRRGRDLIMNHYTDRQVAEAMMRVYESLANS